MKNVYELQSDEKYSFQVSLKDLERLERLFLLTMQIPNNITPEELRLFLRINVKHILTYRKEIKKTDHTKEDEIPKPSILKIPNCGSFKDGICDGTNKPCDPNCMAHFYSL